MFEIIMAVLPSIDVPSPSAPPGAEIIMVVVSWISWAVAIAGIVGLMILGATMALANSRSQGTPEHAGRFGIIVAGMIVAGAAGVIVSLILGV